MGNKVLLSVTAALAMSAAVLAHAESAPVYDADSMQQQNDYSVDQGQDLPMPPPPGQDNAGAFVPAQPTASNAPAAPTVTPTVTVAQDNTAATTGIDQRMKRIEKQVTSLQADSSAARVEALQKEIQTLRGQVDQLTHQTQQMQEQQKSMYTDLDKRGVTSC